MLIEYLFENYPNWEDVGETAIGDLQVSELLSFYKFIVSVSPCYKLWLNGKDLLS